MFDYDTTKAVQVNAEMQTNNNYQSENEPVFKEESIVDSSCFSALQKSITQDGKRIDLDTLNDTKYSVDEYFKLLRNPNLEKKELAVLDKADTKEDDIIVKQSVEKASLVCDLIDKFQDDSDNAMIQYINKAIELNGEDFLSNISFNENDGKKEIIISDGENFISFDTETSEVTDCSAASPWGIIQGTIIGAFDGNTKDGQIEGTNKGKRVTAGYYQV